MKLQIVFPCLPLDARIIDPDFKSEHAAVRLLGGSAMLFDFDLFKKNDIDESFKNIPVLAEPSVWVYRGWMMTPEQYQLFYVELKKRGCVLSTTPDEYNTCHVYPNIYPLLESRAVKSFIVNDTDVDHAEIVKFFGEKKKLFVKDWVKSTKGTPGSTVINDSSNSAEVMSVTTNMIEARGDLFYGGIVYKEFVDVMKRPDGLNEEYRAFFIKDKLITWAQANGTGGQALKPPTWIKEIAEKIPAGFYTIDFVFVEGEDGPEALVLEAGDGGVSGLSADQLPIELYAALEENF